MKSLKRGRGLRSRLAGAFLTIALVVVLLTATLTLLSVTSNFERYVRSNYELRHKRVVQAIEEAYDESGGDWESVRNAAGYLGLLGGFDFVVRDASGKTVLESSQRGMRFRPESFGQGPLNGMMPPGMRRMIAPPRPGRRNDPIRPRPSRSEYPLVVNGRRVGTVSIANPAAFGVLNVLERSFRTSLAWSAFTSALLAGLLGLAVALTVSRRMVGPLIRLKSATDRFARGEFHVRVPVETEDEVGELSAAFNSMSSQLERLEEMRRKLTADIGHEVRTPLAAARSLVEAMRDGVLPADADNLLQVERELGRLGEIVADLRALSVAESGQLQLKRERVDLREVVDEVAYRWTGRFSEKGVALSAETGSLPALVVGDPEALERVFMNLVANAFKYTGGGGSVAIGVKAVAGGVEVRVADTGVGIAEKELPFVFERFYRGAEAKARGVEGTGVGLSIVREIVAAHGGTVRLESSEGRGTTAIVTVPEAQT